jgi:MipA family protein
MPASAARQAAVNLHFATTLYSSGLRMPYLLRHISSQLRWLITMPLMCLAANLSMAVDILSYANGDEPEQPLWEMRLAGFGRFGPSYPASEESQLNVVPLPLPIYRGKFLRLGEDSENPIRGKIFRRDRIKLDFAFDLNFPVDSEDIEARDNMPDLNLLLEIGPELELQFTEQPKFGGHWYLGLQLRPAFSFDGISPDYRGVAFSSEFTYRVKFAEGKDALKVRITPTWGTTKYMAFFYDVQPQFATAERPAYNAKPGYLGTDLTFSYINTLTERWEFVAGTRISLNQGASNKNSPLYTKDYGIGVYAAFTWKFWESKTRAAN